MYLIFMIKCQLLYVKFIVVRFSNGDLGSKYRQIDGYRFIYGNSFFFGGDCLLCVFIYISYYRNL